MAEAVGEEQPLLPNERTYLGLRRNRQPQDVNGCYRFLLKIVEITFRILGLWSYRAWNCIPRVLVSLICIYQAVYDFYFVLGCHGFDCSFLQNSTVSKKPSHHKDDRHVANAVYRIVSLAAVVSYLFFIRCFIVAKHKNSAMVAPSELLMEDLTRTDCQWLCLIFILITILYLSSVAVFYAIIWISQPKDSYFTILATGVGAQFIAQWTAITTCHVFGVSSFAVGELYSENNRISGICLCGNGSLLSRSHNQCFLSMNTTVYFSVAPFLRKFQFFLTLLSLCHRRIVAVLLQKRENLRTFCHDHVNDAKVMLGPFCQQRRVRLRRTTKALKIFFFPKLWFRSLVDSSTWSYLEVKFKSCKSFQSLKLIRLFFCDLFNSCLPLWFIIFVLIIHRSKYHSVNLFAVKTFICRFLA